MGVLLGPLADQMVFKACSEHDLRGAAKPVRSLHTEKNFSPIVPGHSDRQLSQRELVEADKVEVSS